MNSFLKNIMRIMEGNEPVSCGEIGSLLHDNEVLVRSGIKNLENYIYSYASWAHVPDGYY